MRSDTHRRAALVARAAYAGVICLATLSNLNFEARLGPVPFRLWRAFQPMVFGLHSLVVDGVRNVVLFAGLGAVWLVTDEAGHARRSVLVATIAGAVLSLAVESAQLFSPTRYASAMDFLTNAGGATVGAVAAAVLVAAARRALGHPWLMGVPAFVFAGTYLGALLVASVAPFYAPVAVSAGAPWVDAALAAPGGAFLALVLLEAGATPGRAALGAAPIGVLLAWLCHVVRAAVGVPAPPALAVAQALGLALGASVVLLVPRLARRTHDPRRALLVLVLYAGALAVWSWRPFTPRTRLAEVVAQFTAPHLVPLGSVPLRLELGIVYDVAGQSLLFLPLGLLLAVWPLRRRGPLRHVLPAIYLAAVLELGQALVQGRSLDVTDFLVRSAGAAVGLVVALRAGAEPHGESLGGAGRERRRAAQRIVPAGAP